MANIVDFANQVKSYALGIKDQQVLGAWNELPNNGISDTINGITWTKYSDGSVKANGTASSVSYFDLNIGGLVLPKGEHYLSAGSLDENYYSIGGLYVSSNGVDLMTTASESSSHCSLSEDTEVTSCRVFIRSGVTVTDLMIYPMITVEPNQPYVPYVMTNRELSTAVMTTPTITGSGVTYVFARAYTIGRLSTVQLNFKINNAMSAGDTLTFTVGNVPAPINQMGQYTMSGTTLIYIYWSDVNNRVITVQAMGALSANAGVGVILTYVTK